MRRCLIVILLILTSLSFSLTTITYNPSGIKILEVTHWNEKSSIINKKETVYNENNQVLLFIDSKQHVENDIVKKIKVERKMMHDFSTEYEEFSYIGDGYILQKQSDTVIIPAEITAIDLIHSSEMTRRMISEKAKKFNYNDFDAISGQQLNWLYEYNGESFVETEIGEIPCINYRVTLIEGNLSTVLSFDKNGEIIIANFMGSNTYNLEYFPSKDIDKELLNFDTHKIPEYIFGNNYWKEGTAERLMGYVKASSINMIRWGGIYRDHTPRTPEDIKRFRRFIDYTSTEPFIQLEYFSKKSALEQFNELVSFFPSLKHISFSNEANIYPSIMNKNVPLEEFIKTYKEEITALKEQYPKVKIVGPDFTISSYPQYDKWLTEFIKNNGGLIDILSLHYYPFDGSQSKARTLQNVKNFEKYIEQVKELLKKNNMGDIPIAITETNTSYDYSIEGPGDPSTFVSSIWLACSYITAIKENLWSFQHWCIVNDGTLSLMNNIDGLVEYRPTARIYMLFSDFSDEYISTDIDVENIKAIFSPNSEMNLITGVIVNYGNEERDIVIKKTNSKIQIEESSDGDFTLPKESITLVYLNHKLEIQKKTVYTE